MIESRIFSVDAVVDLILEKFKNKADQPFSLAIPGGRSPGPILTELSKQMTDDDKKRLTLLWVDERLVPLDSPDRNDLATLSAWKQGGSLPKRVLTMPGPEGDLKKACDEYEKKLLSACPNGKIDVCLLGIGEDGHFASLFPNHSVLDNKEHVTIVNDSPKAPPLRMTLSLPLIKASALNIVLCFGSEKGEVFKQVKIGSTKQYPISLLNSNNTFWFLDEAATNTIGFAN